MRTSRRLLKQARAALLTAFLFSGFINVLMLAMPLYTLQVFESVVPLGSIETLAILTIIAAAAIAALALLEIVRDMILMRAGLWLDHCLGEFMLENGLKVGVSGGELRQDARALDTLRSFLSSAAVGPFFDGPWVPIFLVALAALHPMIGAVALVSVGLLFVVAVLQVALTERLQREAGEAQERASHWLRLVTTNAQAAGALGLAEGVASRWETTNRSHIAGAYSLGKRISFVKAAARTIRIGAQIAIYGIGAWLVVKEQVSPGALVASAILLGRALAPLEQLVGAIKPAAAAWRAYRRLKALPADFPQALIADSTVLIDGRIKLADVAVMLPGRRIASLRGISLDIAAGESIGIIGPNGAGKSTLAAVLAGAVQPSAGTADLDGLPIARWQRTQQQPPIGYLPDDAMLVEGTVHENIVRFGEASLMSSAAAAIAAGVHERLETLPKGYETEVGIAGAALSMSERRAVALARAVYGAPRVIVLDEPEAGLDGAALRQQMRSLEALRAAGTSLIIATQDPRLLQHVDRIVVLAAGSIARIGTPQDMGRGVAPLRPVASNETAHAAEAMTQATAG